MVNAAVNAFSNDSSHPPPETHEDSKGPVEECPHHSHRQVIQTESEEQQQCPYKSPELGVGGDADDEKNLYQQFGGDRQMAIFVEDFMEGIMGDSELACYHQKFQDPEEMEMLKEKLICYFKWKLDGARFYIGKPMPDVHRNLGITDEVFDKACLIFTASLKKLKTKMGVMRPFVQRISGIRNEICFPPVDQNEEGFTFDTKTEI